MSRPALVDAGGADAVRGNTASAIARRTAVVAVLSLVVVVGATLRLVGTNWDDFEHLHPDDRYLSTVADNIEWPATFTGYFDVEDSPLSPYNGEKTRDYIYGTLPLFATMIAAAAVDDDTYGYLNLVGRRFGALLDTLTILLVFLVTRRLLSDVPGRRAVHGALLAAALYAFTVTAIQHAHFFTTDVWLVFFGTLTFLVALRVLETKRDPGSRSPFALLALLGGCLGLTVACKVSGTLIAVPVALALLARTLAIVPRAGRRRAAVRLLGESVGVLLIAYLSFRAVAPYTFAHSNWLDPSINSSFRGALERQAQATSGDALSPPSYQWLLSPRIFSPLENLTLWQLGVPLALAAFVGLGVLAARIVKAGRTWRHAGRGDSAPELLVPLTRELMLVSFVLTVFLYFAAQFGHSGRYLLPIAPFLAVAAGFGVTVLTQGRRPLWILTSTVLVGLTALYAVAFDQIYTRPNTRIAASNWIAANVPEGSTIRNEHWDDALPVRGPWIDEGTGFALPGAYHGGLVPVFDTDDQSKPRKLYDALKDADYYVLSSPRAWNTIGRLPARFPLMARFYEELFAGRLGFEQVASFTSRPSLLGLQIDDLPAEEAFWVYDHPPVKIFKNEDRLSWAEFRRALCQQPAPPVCT